MSMTPDEFTEYLIRSPIHPLMVKLHDCEERGVTATEIRASRAVAISWTDYFYSEPPRLRDEPDDVSVEIAAERAKWIESIAAGGYIGDLLGVRCVIDNNAVDGLEVRSE